MVSNIINILKIFKNELINVLTDNGTQLIMIGAIFLYGIFYLIPFHNHETRNIPIGIIDMDNSSISREFSRDLNAHRNINIIQYFNNLDDAEEQFYRNKIKGFILIPKDFEHDIKRGKPTTITSYTDSAFLIIYKQIATAVAETTNYFSSAVEIDTLMKKGINKDQAMSIVSPVDFIQNPLYNPIGSYQNYIYPMVLIMILQQTMLIGTSMLCSTQREVLHGVKINNSSRIYIKKVNNFSNFTQNPFEIVLGKGFAYVLLYFIYGMMYFLIFPAIAVYDMSYHIGAMLILFVPFLFACAFMGISLTYFCKKREYSCFLVIPTSVPLIFLPGFVWAREAIPPILNFLSKFVPFEPAAEGLVKVNQMGATFTQVLPDFFILVLLCVIYYFSAVYTVKNIIHSTKNNSL